MSRECHPIPCPPFREMPAGRILVDEPFDDELAVAMSAAAAVRDEFAVRAGGRGCGCPPDPILDRTPEARLREALDAGPVEPVGVVESVVKAIELSRGQWHRERMRHFTEWLGRNGF